MNALAPLTTNSPTEAAAMVLSAWQRTYGTRDWHRSRARTCWHEAVKLRRYIITHGWNFNQDQTDQLIEEAADLRKEAAAHVRQSRRIA